LLRNREKCKEVLASHIDILLATIAAAATATATTTAKNVAKSTKK
jgi:hypothetical protein